jgi:hypothetical protein
MFLSGRLLYGRIILGITTFRSHRRQVRGRTAMIVGFTAL